MYDIDQINNLIGDSISGVVTTIVILTILFVPLLLYLKYKMEIKIVKKGTLQALNEFYNKGQITEPIDNKDTTVIESIDNAEPNINKDETL